MVTRATIQSAATVALLLTAVTFAGCAQRLIRITSEPSGALVHLNDQEVGRTPVTVPFTFYGVYDVRVEHDGYTTLWTKQEAEAPWWEAPGPDLLGEMVGAKSELKWHFTLEPMTVQDESHLLGHAKQLRAMLREESANDAQ